MNACVAGIVGATVMPHNLYLHSNLVRKYSPQRGGAASRRQAMVQALCGVILDTLSSLGFAFLINASLLIDMAPRNCSWQVRWY